MIYLDMDGVLADFFGGLENKLGVDHWKSLSWKEEVFAKLKKTGRPIAIFGLTDKGYAHLGENLSAIRALIQQQKTIIAAYEAYYKNAEKALEDANKQVDAVNDEVKELNSKEPEGFTLQKLNPFK